MLLLKMLLLLLKCCTNREKDDKIVVKAGSYNGEVMNAAQVAELASIPSREELLSNCCSLCKLLYQALRVVWLLWQRKKAGEEAA